jgi:uncharacterized protein (TIGR03546 family)
MTLILKQIFNFLKLLNSDKGSNQIAAGIVAGMILGFTPAFSLQTLLVILCIFFFRIQIGAALMTAPFFKIFAYLLDPLFDKVGGAVLELNALRGIFTTLYNLPVIPLTRFNNSVVMGSGVVALLLAPVVFVLANRLIAAYREKIVAQFKGTKVWKAFTASTLYNWYTKYESLTGNN